MRFYIITAIVAIAVVVGFGGYRYVSNMQQTIAELRYNQAVLEANNASLQSALQLQKKALDSYVRDNQLKDEIIRETMERFDETRQMVRDTEDRLNETNLSTLAQENPDVVLQIINDRATNMNRCLEVASGSPLTEADAVGNPECPALIPRTYEGPQ